MSGIRQHFFPRFLKRGFASKIKRNEVFTWVFVKDKVSYETNIKNIGLEKYFYGSPKDSQVDDIITDKENEFAYFIGQLREKNKEINLDPRLPSELITHLIVRTQHIRESLTDSGKTVVNIFQKNIQNSADFKKLLINLVKTKPEEIDNSLRKEFIKKLPPNTPSDLIEKFIKFAKLYIPKIIEQEYEQGHIFFNQLFEKMNEKMNSLAKGAQIKVLLQGVVPEKHLEKFGSFNWRLFVINTGNFISGDIGPIGFYKPICNFQPFLFPKGEIDQVLLPISNTHIIVGSHQAPLLKHTHDQINEAIASMSKYYFISSKVTERNRQLSGFIGKESLNISNSELMEAERQIRKDFYS